MVIFFQDRWRGLMSQAVRMEISADWHSIYGHDGTNLWDVEIADGYF